MVRRSGPPCPRTCRLRSVNHLLLAISAGLGACVVLLLALLAALVSRTGRVADERVSIVMRELQGRMDDLGRELAVAVDRAEEEGRRSRFLCEVSGSLDLDEVLARTLQAATGAVPDADAAIVRLENQKGGPTIAAHGLSADGAESVTGPPDG